MGHRIEKLKKILSQMNLDALIISSPYNIFYLSGVTFLEPSEHEGFLLITKNDNYFITSSLYSEAAQLQAKNFNLLEINVKTSIADLLKKVMKMSKLKHVGFEEDSLTVSEYTRFKKILPLTPSGGIVEELRQIKEDSELEKIRKACEITDDCFKYVLKEIKVGVTEIEISNKIKRFFEDMGHQPSFSPVVAFGHHSSMPHHVAGSTHLSKNQIVLIDFGMKFEGYSSDMTRTVFFGKAPDKFKKMYQTVLDSQTKAFEFLNSQSSINLSDVDNIARDYIIKQGFPTIPHSLGHGVGIEVHDGIRLSPTSKDKAQNNMVFTIEPGIYIPGLGGVRIEDVVVYKNGPVFLTHSNRTLIEI